MDNQAADGLAIRAAAMHRLSHCPACGGAEASAAFNDNDLTTNSTLPGQLRRSDYLLCGNCALIYASWRQVPEAMAPYYALFAELEHRNYADYPPPAGYRRGKEVVSRWIAEQLDRLSALKPDMEILHIRCDCGTLGPVIRERMSSARVMGLDYFESNVRYAQETEALEALQLNPESIPDLPGRSFDLVIANHMFTHTVDPQKDLATCSALLKPGGLFFVYNEMDFREVLKPGGRYFRLRPVNNYHKQLFTPQSLARMFIQEGFEILETGRRKNTITLAMRKTDKHGALTTTAATASELTSLDQSLMRWTGLRESWIKPLLDIGAVRKIYRLVAQRPKPIEPI